MSYLSCCNQILFCIHFIQQLTFLEDPWVQRRGALGASSGVGATGQGTSSQNNWEGKFMFFLVRVLS